MSYPFTYMLQQVVHEAQQQPMDGSVIMTKRYFASQDTGQELKRQAEQETFNMKRYKLEQTIQRLKERQAMLNSQEIDVIVVDETSSSDSGDELDVVGGDGPTAAEFSVGEDVIEIVSTESRQNGQTDQTHRPNQCTYCLRILASPSLLKEHISIMHLNERNFPCTLCTSRFGRRGGLRRHVQMVHSNQLHKCTFEGCTHPGYKSPQALQAHVRSVHTKERPFTCEVCSRGFVRKNDLVTHVKTHMKEPSFSCVCGTRFRRMVYLKKHQKHCVYAMDAQAKGLPTEVRNYDDNDQHEIDIEMVRRAQEQLINKDVKLNVEQFFPAKKEETPCSSKQAQKDPLLPNVEAQELTNAEGIEV